ncbi:hypothetical protein Barb6_01785 [Bacteroidales bacterium Barb6]|nr:hypothetical protein Barb6_01785 [Bacteroidales bacterium Barb6]
MNCPKCSSEKKIKSGFAKGRQRYKCKKCGYKVDSQTRINEKAGSSFVP